MQTDQTRINCTPDCWRLVRLRICSARLGSSRRRHNLATTLQDQSSADRLLHCC